MVSAIAFPRAKPAVYASPGEKKNMKKTEPIIRQAPFINYISIYLRVKHTSTPYKLWNLETKPMKSCTNCGSKTPFEQWLHGHVTTPSSPRRPSPAWGVSRAQPSLRVDLCDPRYGSAAPGERNPWGSRWVKGNLWTTPLLIYVQRKNLRVFPCVSKGNIERSSKETSL